MPIDRLLGRQLPFVAIAVGTISPDLEFFVRGRIERTIGHTAHGALLLDVPLGLAFLMLLNWFAVPAIQALLPPSLAHLGPALDRAVAVLRRTSTDLRSLAGIVVALLIGAGSHILWDAFTQAAAVDPTGTPYRSLAWLDRFPFTIGEASFALHSVLHWLSTAGGLVVVMIALDRWIERQRPPAETHHETSAAPAATRRAGWALTAAAVAVFVVQHPVARAGDGPGRPSGLSDVLATGAVWALAGCFVGLVLVGTLVRLGVLPTGGAGVPLPPDPDRPVGRSPNEGSKAGGSPGDERPEPLRGPAVKPSPLGPRSPGARR